MISYGYVKEVDRPFEEVLQQLPKILEKEGFGVVSTIDIGQKLRDKLGVDFRKYVILGACKPPSAYKALSVEENIGLMLPCNVIVYDRDGTTVVGTIRPEVVMRTIGNPALEPVAAEVEASLKRVFEAI